MKPLTSFLSVLFEKLKGIAGTKSKLETTDTLQARIYKIYQL
ncbi:hypothetical protein [Bacillus mycoides]|nr:hypothetical protein [Bacillus mycoides]MED1383772.1 hypothetical protein [Bacillus mycoides]